MNQPSPASNRSPDRFRKRITWLLWGWSVVILGSAGAALLVLYFGGNGMTGELTAQTCRQADLGGVVSGWIFLVVAGIFVGSAWSAHSRIRRGDHSARTELVRVEGVQWVVITTTGIGAFAFGSITDLNTCHAVAMIALLMGMGWTVGGLVLAPLRMVLLELRLDVSDSSNN